MNPKITERARRYLGSVPPAIAGSGGDAATYKAAVALVKGFSLTLEQALPLLLEWNGSCVPPWKESELRAKLASAARCNKPDGFLLKDTAAGPEREPSNRAAKRRLWPVFRKPSLDEISRISHLRGVSTEAAYLLSLHGHLWRCRWRDAECLAIRRGSFAQVRRMDGQPFGLPNGSTVKALNLPGCSGSFLNPGGLGAPNVPVILTEGAISLLEAAEAIQRAILCSGTQHSAAILAAVSAQSRFTREQLERLAGRRIRIVPDADSPGQDAATIWTANLRNAGCTVDCVRLPKGSKDLGDALRQIPAGDSYWLQLLTL